MDDKKKALALLILGKAKKPGMRATDAPSMGGSDAEAEGNPGDDEAGEDAGATSAMSDFISALKGNDPAGALTAFRSLKELC